MWPLFNRQFVLSWIPELIVWRFRIVKMNLPRFCLLVAFAVPAILAAGTPSNTLTVCPSGCDHTSIQAAVSSSVPGGTVEVRVAGAHTEGPIQILNDVTIRGLGRDTTFVQQALSLSLADRSVFVIGLGATVTLQTMTIQKGRDPLGGCIFNLDGEVLLLDVDVSQCDGGDGGAILNRGDMTLQGVTLIANEATRGGGIFNEGGILLIENSSIIFNAASSSGGGLYNEGIAELRFTEISHNLGHARGGGIYNALSTQLQLASCLIDDNRILPGGAGGINEGGGIYNLGQTMDILRTTITGNQAIEPGGTGGGLHVANSGAINFRENTVVNNLAEQGGGLWTNVPIDLANSTLSGNEAIGDGGGLYVEANGDLRLSNVTITDNTADSDQDNNGNGGGVFNESGQVQILNTLIAGNFDGSDVFHINGTDCYGTLLSNTYNLIGSLGSTGIGGDPACVISGFTAGNTIGENAQLGPLADNGGPTLTHALLAGSPAIDTGDPGGCNTLGGGPLNMDQRGYLRLNRCDRGAFELGALAPDLIFADGFESGSTSRWSSSQ